MSPPPETQGMNGTPQHHAGPQAQTKASVSPGCTKRLINTLAEIPALLPIPHLLISSSCFAYDLHEAVEIGTAQAWCAPRRGRRMGAGAGWPICGAGLAALPLKSLTLSFGF